MSESLILNTTCYLHVIVIRHIGWMIECNIAINSIARHCFSMCHPLSVECPLQPHPVHFAHANSSIEFHIRHHFWKQSFSGYVQDRSNHSLLGAIYRYHVYVFTLHIHTLKVCLYVFFMIRENFFEYIVRISLSLSFLYLAQGM